MPLAQPREAADFRCDGTVSFFYRVREAEFYLEWADISGGMLRRGGGLATSCVGVLGSREVNRNSGRGFPLAFAVTTRGYNVAGWSFAAVSCSRPPVCGGVSGRLQSLFFRFPVIFLGLALSLLFSPGTVACLLGRRGWMSMDVDGCRWMLRRRGSHWM